MMQPPNPAGVQDAESNDTGDDQATIGVSVKVNGDISGKQDLTVNGTVEGTIDFRENNVLIGKKGRVHANVIAKNINVEGEVKGELRGSGQITIKPSGRVVGDIRAPRVILNDGCQFKGSVDMDEKTGLASDARNRGMAAKLAGVRHPGQLVGQPDISPKR